MQYKALNRVLLINKALSIYKKKNKLHLTPLHVNVLYSAILIQQDQKKVTSTNILKMLHKQSIFPVYQSSLDAMLYFTSLDIFILSSDSGVYNIYIVSSYGLSVLNSFELCLRRVRHDR